MPQKISRGKSWRWNFPRNLGTSQKLDKFLKRPFNDQLTYQKFTPMSKILIKPVRTIIKAFLKIGRNLNFLDCRCKKFKKLDKCCHLPPYQHLLGSDCHLLLPGFQLRYVGNVSDGLPVRIAGFVAEPHERGVEEDVGWRAKDFHG